MLVDLNSLTSNVEQRLRISHDNRSMFENMNLLEQYFTLLLGDRYPMPYHEPSTAQMLNGEVFSNQTPDTHNWPMFYGEVTGLLYIGCRSQDVDSFRCILNVLDMQSSQIRVEAKTVTVSSGETKAGTAASRGVQNIIPWLRTNSASSFTLSAADTANLIDFLEKDPDIELMNLSELTTMSGRKVQVGRVIPRRVIAPNGRSLLH